MCRVAPAARRTRTRRTLPGLSFQHALVASRCARGIRSVGISVLTSATRILERVPIDVVTARRANIRPRVEQDPHGLVVLVHARGLQGGLAVPPLRRRIHDPRSLLGAGVSCENCLHAVWVAPTSGELQLGPARLVVVFVAGECRRVPARVWWRWGQAPFVSLFTIAVC